MVNIQEISIKDYLSMTEEQKKNFYDSILINNKKVQKNTHYLTVINPAKQAKIPEFLEKQKNGYLTYVAPLRRANRTTNGGLSFLTVCDCNNWHILDAIDFRKEKQQMCPFCKIKNTTTMKDISGEIFGQLQALFPSEKRGKDGSVYWICSCIDCGNIQEVIKYNLTRKNGHLCSVCGEKSKGEYKIAQLLKKHNIPFEKEKTFKDCFFPDTKNYARFDFFVNNQYIIEVDGQHHFFPVKYGENISDEKAKTLYEKVIQHDKYKNQYCIKHNIPIIRIPYISIDNLTYQDIIVEKSKFLLYN